MCSLRVTLKLAFNVIIMVWRNWCSILAELGLMQYPVAVLNRPSMLAASAVYAARQTL